MDTRFPYVTAIFFVRLTVCVSLQRSVHTTQCIIYIPWRNKNEGKYGRPRISPCNKHHLYPLPTNTPRFAIFYYTERPTGISINHAGHVSPCGVHYSEYQSFSKRQNNNQYSTPNSYLGLGFFFLPRPLRRYIILSDTDKSLTDYNPG